MARAKQRAKRKPLSFPRRITIRLDDDVRELANFSAKRSKWETQAHFVNACVRRVMAPLAPEIPVQQDPFEQLALATPRTTKP